MYVNINIIHLLDILYILYKDYIINLVSSITITIIKINILKLVTKI